MALEQFSSEYFDFPCQFSFHQLFHIHHTSSRASIIDQIVVDVPSGLSLTPRQEKTLRVVCFTLWTFGSSRQLCLSRLESSDLETTYKQINRDFLFVSHSRSYSSSYFLPFLLIFLIFILLFFAFHFSHTLFLL
jgi:hypothetical protein